MGGGWGGWGMGGGWVSRERKGRKNKTLLYIYLLFPTSPLPLFRSPLLARFPFPSTPFPSLPRA